jgi:hypothetical protein
MHLFKKCNVPKSAFYPRLLSSLGCASARKLRLGPKDAFFGLDTQITISVFKVICDSTKFTIFHACSIIFVSHLLRKRLLPVATVAGFIFHLGEKNEHSV